VAAELFRVLRPGGTLGRANWGPFGFQAEFFATLRRYRGADPEGVPPPPLWGDEPALRERLDGLAGSVDVERRSLVWEFESFPAMGQFFQRHGPRDIGDMPEDRALEMMGEMGQIVERHNSATDGSVRVEAEYSLVVARKRG
jgi:hypothetical protein